MGRMPAIGNPLKMNGDSALPLRAAPGLGEQTDEVLEEAGFSPTEIDALRDSGVI
jgi:crotonobetainyl-CoA:carnitine CoA-transferase CaiB-like acyl-CoA transferase